MQCVAKKTGEICRFKDWRAFPIDPDTAQIIGEPFFIDVGPEVPRAALEFPSSQQFNRDITQGDIVRLKVCALS